MELELDRTQLNGFETVLETTVCHEETLEAIVPDACPDILRVWDTEGTVCLQKKEALEGKVECGGTVRAAILYLPDGEEELRKMEVILPFHCTADHTAISPRCVVVAVPRIQSAETRLLNPRKVLVRANVTLQIQIYTSISDIICGGVLEAETSSIEQRIESGNTYIVACVQEKPFTYSDELSLSANKAAADEVLKSRTLLQCGEAKVIGNKLIFKGTAQLQVLYRAMEGGLSTAEFELPFSQIMEVSGAGEEATCEIQVILTDVDCTLGGGDGRTFSVSLGMLAQAVVREMRTVEMLADVYSTAYELETETQAYTLKRLLDHNEKEQTLREILETGALAKEIFDAYACITSMTQAREGERLILSADVQVTVLYQTEDGACTTAVRTLQAVCPLDLPETSVCFSRCECPLPVYASPTAGGIEVRFPVRFYYSAQESRKAVSVTAVRVDETAPKDHSKQPSIVLRMVGDGECLWDIAKSYGTTTRDIMQANGQEEDHMPVGQLLLIPRKR